MKKFCLALSLIFAFFQVQAQKDFRPGYIITLPGDTLKGEVNLKSHKKNAHTCEFRKTGSKEKLVYAPGEIQGYGVENGPQFRTYTLPATVGLGKEKATIKQFYFLNVLVEGQASLFMTYEISGRSRFFVQKDTVFKELEIRENTVKNEKDGRNYKVKTRLYVGTLTYLLQDCPTIQPVLQKTELKPSDLIFALKKYNECVSPGAPFFVQKPAKPVIKMGFIAGATMSLVNFYTPGSVTEISKSNGYLPGFTAGLTINSTLPFLGKNMSLQAELAFVRSFFNHQYKYQKLDLQGRLIRYNLTSDIRLDVLELPVHLRYTLNLKKVKPYVNAGLLYSYALGQKDQSTYQTIYASQTSNRRVDGLFHLTDFTLGFSSAGGVLIPLKKEKNLVLEVKYRPEFIPHLFGLDSKVTTFHFVTGVQF